MIRLSEGTIPSARILALVFALGVFCSWYVMLSIIYSFLSKLHELPSGCFFFFLSQSLSYVSLWKGV